MSVDPGAQLTDNPGMTMANGLFPAVDGSGTREPPPRMDLESREAPEVLRRQQDTLAQPIAELVAALRRKPPRVVVTCARGSSAHAATFGKHLIERHLGIPVSAAAPNIASLYRQSLRLDGQLFLAVSQAGRSDDIVENARMAPIVRRDDGRARERCRQSAGASLRDRAADAGRAGAERRGEQIVRRVAWPRCLRLAAAVGRRRRDAAAPSTVFPSASHAAADLDWSAALAALSAREQRR